VRCSVFLLAVGREGQTGKGRWVVIVGTVCRMQDALTTISIPDGAWFLQDEHTDYMHDTPNHHVGTICDISMFVFIGGRII
jgi:hypothetical protein